MSTFEVPVYKIRSVEKHPNADSLDILTIEGFTTIQPIGKYRVGEKVAYIPADSVLPEALIEELGLTGRLDGPLKNRVRPVRLRGTYSEGLVYRANEDWKVGQDVAEILGITKFKVEVPVHLKGHVNSPKNRPGLSGETIPFDVEDVRKSLVLFEGCDVQATEKIHGTCFQVGLFPENSISRRDRFKNFFKNLFKRRSLESAYELHMATSKGLAKEGLQRRLKFEDGVANDIYWRTAIEYGCFEPAVVKTAMKLSDNRPVFIIGEIFGPGIQKGFPYGESIQTRIFDVYVGTKNNGSYLSPHECKRFLDLLNVAGANLQYVPVLYEGPFDIELLKKLSEGNETISGKEMHIREGIVISDLDRRNKKKLVSDTYKLKKDVTEHE